MRYFGEAPSRVSAERTGMPGARVGAELSRGKRRGRDHGAVQPVAEKYLYLSHKFRFSEIIGKKFE